MVTLNLIGFVKFLSNICAEFNGDSEEEREAKQDADQENLAEDFKEMNLVDGKVERKGGAI